MQIDQLGDNLDQAFMRTTSGTMQGSLEFQGAGFDDQSIKKRTLKELQRFLDGI